MNEDDRKAFEEWINSLAGFRCRCNSCNNEREKSWRAALEYERSSSDRQTVKHTIEQLRAENDNLSYEMASLKTENKWLLAENKRLVDACEACENGDRRRQNEPEPEKVFIGCDCKKYREVFPGEYHAKSGHGWRHCPWCGKSLWRERKIVSIERDAIVSLRGMSGGDGYEATVAHFANGRLYTVDEEIRAKAVITFTEES